MISVSPQKVVTYPRAQSTKNRGQSARAQHMLHVLIDKTERDYKKKINELKIKLNRSQTLERK
jgi:hypothetical protein